MAQTPVSQPNPPLAEGGFATSDATDPYLWLEDVTGDDDERDRRIRFRGFRKLPIRIQTGRQRA